MGKLAYEQYSDTTKTLQSILDILNDSFSDTATKAVSIFVSMHMYQLNEIILF